jgi:hypothetical protein
VITLEEIKAYLGIPEEDASEDAILTELERNAVAFVQTQTRRYFGPPAPHVEYIMGTGTRHLWIPDLPLEPEAPEPIDPPDPEAPEPEPLPRLTVAEYTQPGAEPVEVLDFDLRLFDVEAVAVRHGGVFWDARREYAAGYLRGYYAGEEPGDIRQLVMDLVSIKRTLRGSEGLRSESMGGYSYTRFGETDLDAVMGGWATINAWRRLVFA